MKYYPVTIKGSIEMEPTLLLSWNDHFLLGAFEKHKSEKSLSGNDCKGYWFLVKKQIVNDQQKLRKVTPFQSTDWSWTQSPARCRQHQRTGGQPKPRQPRTIKRGQIR